MREFSKKVWRVYLAFLFSFTLQVSFLACLSGLRAFQISRGSLQVQGSFITTILILPFCISECNVEKKRKENLNRELRIST
jgi:hypothetical protein